MILCVALSPAWDVTYGVPHFREHATNRVHSVAGRAGGKAVNVARVLHALGEEVAVVTPVGGPTGELFLADLAAAGIEVIQVPDDTDVRRTVTVVSDETGDATVLNEPSHLSDWQALLAKVEHAVAEASVVVAAGSLPRGAPVDAFAQLVTAARSRGIPVAVDTSGPALEAAIHRGPTLVKPNLAELRGITHVPDPTAAARELASGSGAAVAVTLGADGMVLTTGDEVWSASCGEVLRGNPTGAGDAALAAFAQGLGAGRTWPDMLHDAVALSAAAVLAPSAGDFHAEEHQRLAARVVVERAEVQP